MLYLRRAAESYQLPDEQHRQGRVGRRPGSLGHRSSDLQYHQSEPWRWW